MTDEVKKKPGRPRKDGTPRKDNAPKTETAAENQKKTQFTKGVSGNPGGANFRKPTLEFRGKCHSIVHEHGLAMLVNLMYDAYENGKHEEALEIIKWMAAMAYGTPRQMTDYESMEAQHKPTALPSIVVSRETLNETLASDSQYE